jgi:hypothetical protein
MVVNGGRSSAEGFGSTAIGANVQIKHDGAVAVSAMYMDVNKGPYPTCVSSGTGSLTLCAETTVNVTGDRFIVNGIDILAELARLKAVNVTGDRFIVNGIDILAELARLKADLQKCTGSGRRLDTGCAGDKATASGLLVGTLLALSLTATAVA